MNFLCISRLLMSRIVLVSMFCICLATATHANNNLGNIEAVDKNAEPKSEIDPKKPWSRGRLTVKSHMLVHENGEPFFYLADTAWELFHRLDREEVEHYLANRASKGFNVIQAVALAELQGLSEPNAYGHYPLVNKDPSKPDVRPGDNNDYWDHVDFVISRANYHGLYIAFLPIWGQWVHPKWMEGIEPIFEDYETSYAYGKWIAEKYKHHPNIIWVIGGDRIPENDLHVAAFDGMASGINDSDDEHLITYHPQGWGDLSSQNWWHEKAWLDFNMGQTGHSTKNNLNVIKMMENDRAKRPIKPSINAEPAYEDHPINWNAENGYFRAYDVRQNAYWSVFSGAAGFTYGHHSIWQMYDEGRKNINFADRYWHEALDRPGVNDIKHLKSLIHSYPYFERRPAPEIFTQLDKSALPVVAMRGDRFAMLYFPSKSLIKINQETLPLSNAKTYWYDPRNGEKMAFTSDLNGQFQPPNNNQEDAQDIVLIIELPY